MTEPTDWTAYYQRTPSYTKITRSISTRKIIGVLKAEAARDPIDICELGGANSCFVDDICSQIDVSAYHVVDMNAFGLSLLEKKSPNCRLTYEQGDVLASYDGSRQFDVVYSVGLIEHFAPADTKRAIASHFQRCKNGGLVLITFPTPTPLYRTIRAFAEAAGKWSFPDERPLQFDEVRTACVPFGTVVHESINWPILLTQGYMAVRKP